MVEGRRVKSRIFICQLLGCGVGSNDIGLDRSQQGGERVVYFEKRGLKLLLVQPNLRYIAQSTNELEKIGSRSLCILGIVRFSY